MRGIRSAAVGAVVVAVLSGTGAAAHAAPPGAEGGGGMTTFASEATCHFTADMSLDPGVADQVVTSDFATVGEVPFYCTEGSVNGSPVIPDVAGSYQESGLISGDCRSGQGHGQFEAYIPTEAGTQHITGDFDMWYADGAGGESSRDDQITAQFSFTPKQGGCTAADPLVVIAVNQTETLLT